MRKVLVVYCHPNPKSYTHAVMEAVESGLRRGDATVERIDLHADGFDPVLIVDEERRRRDLDKVEATRRYRDLVAWCDALVMIYPVWWGGFPAMLKGFVDRVFVSGLTYSFQGRPKDAVLPEGLMRGKDAHCFYTLDSPAIVAWLDPGWWSSYFSVLKYCGFRRVERHYLTPLKRTSHETRSAWLAEVERRAQRISVA